MIVVGVTVTTLLLSQWDWWWSELPGDLREAGPLPYGLLLGLGGWCWVSCRTASSSAASTSRPAPSADRPRALALTIYDQADFVLVVWLLLLPLWVMTPLEALWVFAGVVKLSCTW